MKFGLLWIGEFVEIVVVSGLVTALFFGGWQVPYLNPQGFSFPWGWEIGLGRPWVVLMQMGSFVFKVSFFCWLQMLIRWTLPRFRYDQLMRFGWKGLLPLALINIVVTGLVLLTLR